MKEMLGFLIATTVLPLTASGQRRSIGVELAAMVGGDERVSHECYQRGYSIALGGRITIPILTDLTSVELAVRGYQMATGPACVDGLVFPPPDGTYDETVRLKLQVRPFLTTDVRLGTRLGKSPLLLAVGGGNAWHTGHDLPYFVVAAGFVMVERPGVLLAVEVDYHWLRVTSDRVRRTYQGGQVVVEQLLGQVHDWGKAGVLALRVGVPF